MPMKKIAFQLKGFPMGSCGNAEEQKICHGKDDARHSYHYTLRISSYDDSPASDAVASATLNNGLAIASTGETPVGNTLNRQQESPDNVVKSLTGTAPNRYVYYPGTEELK